MKKKNPEKGQTLFGIATLEGVEYEGKIFPYLEVIIQNGEKFNKASFSHKPFKNYLNRRVHFALNHESKAYNVWLVDDEGNPI